MSTGVRGEERKGLESEYGTRSGTHKYTVSQSGTKSIARTYAAVYACTRTPRPEDTNGELSIFPAAFATSRKPRFLRKNTRTPWA